MYLPNLLPEHSRVELGIHYPDCTSGPAKNAALIQRVFSYLGAIAFGLTGVISLIMDFGGGFFFLVMSCILVPEIHQMIERTFRFSFTWMIKLVVFFLLWIPVILMASYRDTGTTSQNTVETETREIQAENDAKAKKTAEKLDKMRKDSLGHYLTLAETAAKKKKYGNAANFMSNALIYAPSSVHNEMREKRASWLLQGGKYAAAADDYGILVSNNYQSSHTLYQRAVCYQKLNRKVSAVEDLRKAMKLGNIDAEKLYEKLNPLRRRIIGYQTLCCDGSISYSTGRGTCSHHGGVCNWNDPVYETYRQY